MNLKKIIILYIVFLFFVVFSFPIRYHLKYYFSNKRTPIDAIQEEVPSIFNNPKIKVPVVAYQVISPRIVKTYRDNENIKIIVEKASRILNQADIELELIEIRKSSIPKSYRYEEGLIFPEPIEFQNIIDTEDYLRIFFIKKNPFLTLTKGAAFKDNRTAYVIDKHDKNDFDFVILAHEIGHLFGLGHPNEKYGYLMGYGIVLTEEEAKQIYDRAKERWGN